ncbi:uncharacterized protein BDR25DRAFT_271479 [Lindgomyces ingoldianus]|uniref:Uncharacterized protein n=1 Tax=Lindgomyces ingoldianus TaxID=673940 RepID=A0ACB6QCU1_9PLEO|nr:uncharacterized protein BDR25DRAFT_271479 [Lindgomyces ingoldianus]KAF2464788.1 hypothetical protein BDR25DRAFT_271479 [Lindgomyces ingoldianus]
MPPDRNRASNPQGRQKSCLECAKSKRRCDLRHPACLRCTKQNLTCSYPPQPSAGDASTWQSDSTPPECDAADNVFHFDMQTFSNSQPVGLMDFDVAPGEASSLDALNNLFNTEEDRESYFPLARSNYAQGKSFSASHISDFAYSRVKYCIEELKRAPITMVSENRTPWSHPLLYEDYMPRCLQDAHAACALYIARNDTNDLFVARHVTDRVKELLDSPTPAVPIEVLARAHSLILYQVIHIFSADIRYHGRADATFPHLEEAGRSLHLIVHQESDFSDPIPLYPSATARSAWRDFIFRESKRRTLLILFHFIAMCNLLRGSQASCSHEDALGSRVSFSAHLWKAASAFDFAIAWNQKKHHLVRDLDLSELLDTAHPDDIDTFGRMLMTGLMGIDDVKGWFHTRGGAF